MRVLVQRVSSSRVLVNGDVVGHIDEGLLVLVGFTDTDGEKEISYLAKKVCNLRIFPDEMGVMNKSVLDVGGKVLSVSQFTLYADASKGNRPSYIKALNGDEAKVLYEKFNKELAKYVQVETGIFKEHMLVSLENVGPTTIWLEK